METMAHATCEDLLRVPQNMVAELIDGEVYASPRPGYRHANAASELLTMLRRHLDRPDGVLSVRSAKKHPSPGDFTFLKSMLILQSFNIYCIGDIRCMES